MFRLHLSPNLVLYLSSKYFYMSRRIRVRFAPSPTGPLHLGGVRTALYNYLFAKKHGGDFILRIEDTDQNRLVPGAEEYIIESLKWSGIVPDEGVGFGEGTYKPYRQSDRKSIYSSYADQLVKNGKAYYAFDSPDELEEMRKKIESSGSAFSYNSITRINLKNSLTLSEEEVVRLINSDTQHVIRLKVPANEEISVNDIIRGLVTVSTNEMDDKVLFKSDGMPTYHLANVVDDYLMKISHVIRGEEWLPSAPIHVLLYRSLGWENDMPQFAHLPLLLKPDGNGKLSKRDGDRLGFPVFPIQWKDPVTGIVSPGYREKGFFSDAFINMLALLGWHSSNDKEIYTIDELVQEFSLERVSKGGSKFDYEKAKWFNLQYLKKLSDNDLGVLFMKDISEKIDNNNLQVEIQDHDQLEKLASDNNFCREIVKLLREKVHFVSEFWSLGYFFFTRPVSYDEMMISKRWNEKVKEFFTSVAVGYSEIDDFTFQQAETVFKNTATEKNMKAGEVMPLFRVLLIGVASGPGLFETATILGKDEVLARLNIALNKLP